MVHKLAQIIGVEKSTKAQVERELTDAYQLIQKAAPVLGLSRTFRHAAEPKPGEVRETPPDQKQAVQVRVEDVLKDTARILTKLYDITATKDSANCSAKADVKLDDTTIFLSGLPVTTLIFLEKKLVDIRTLVSKMPVLDTAETWHYDEGRGCYASDPASTHSTKKVKKVIQITKATDKHPEQAAVYDDEEVVGHWTTVKFSGALPKDRQSAILDRVEKLIKAIKFAVAEANMGNAPEVKVGEKIFGYLFAK